MDNDDFGEFIRRFATLDAIMDVVYWVLMVFCVAALILILSPMLQLIG